MKKILLLTVILMGLSCSSTQNSSENWVGKTKQNFIKNWGPAIRTLDDEKSGEILIYADQVYANNNNRHSNSELSDSNYWNYTFVYVNKEGKIASLRKEKQVFPPQQINAVDLLGKNSISAK